MLSVYDSGQKYPVVGYSDFYITHVDGGEDTLNFTVSVDDEIYKYLAEENQVEYRDNRYLIKSIDAPTIYANITCVIDLDFLKSSFHRDYDSGSVSLFGLLSNILPVGWTVSGYNPEISRTIRLENATNYDVILQAATTYSVRFMWSVLTKTVTVINPEYKAPSGAYLTDELNLRSIAFKGESVDFITRLYPYGANGMTIESVNDGLPYIENHQYSNKIVCGYWDDERYTVAESLKADAEQRLAALSAPQRSYECDVIDLVKFDEKYNDFSFSLYKVVTLIDRIRNVRLNHQIMEHREYPDEPQKNMLILSSVTPKVQGAISKAQNTADDALDGALKAGIRIDGMGIELAGKVSFTNLEEPGQTIINGSNITTGIIQGPDGRFYFNFETGDSAVQRLVKADGETIMNFDSDTGRVSCFGPFSVSSLLYAAGAQIGGTGGGLTVNGATNISGNVSASNLHLRSRQVLVDATLSNVGGTYTLNKSFATINYWSNTTFG